MAAAAEAETAYFTRMSEVTLQQWVDNHPGRINDEDAEGYTPLNAAISRLNSLPLTLYLLDEKDADIHHRSTNGCTPIQKAKSVDIITALLQRGADPSTVDDCGYSALMGRAAFNDLFGVKRLLEDARVRATIDEQDRCGRSALQYAIYIGPEATINPIVSLLLQAGANPAHTVGMDSRP